MTHPVVVSVIIVTIISLACGYGVLLLRRRLDEMQGRLRRRARRHLSGHGVNLSMNSVAEDYQATGGRIHRLRTPLTFLDIFQFHQAKPGVITAPLSAGDAYAFLEPHYTSGGAQLLQTVFGEADWRNHKSGNNWPQDEFLHGYAASIERVLDTTDATITDIQAYLQKLPFETAFDALENNVPIEYALVI